MLIYFTDAVTTNQIAINPEYVTGVFIANDEQFKGKTVIALLNSSFLVTDTQIEAVGKLQGELK